MSHTSGGRQGSWTGSYLPGVEVYPGALLLSSLWAPALAQFLSLQLLMQPLPEELAGLPQCLPLGSQATIKATGISPLGSPKPESPRGSPSSMAQGEIMVTHSMRSRGWAGSISAGLVLQREEVLKDYEWGAREICPWCWPSCRGWGRCFLQQGYTRTAFPS